MQTQTLTDEQRREIRAQVAGLLGRNPAFGRLSRQEQAQATADTERIVSAMAESRAGPGDPYLGLAASRGLATGQDFAGGGNVWTQPAAPGTVISGGARQMMQKQMDAPGSIIDVGVTEAAKMVREIDFPAFVASLIEGTFHAIVKSSIEQLKAYAEMVRSVSTSLNDFKDRNTTDNQARDHLVSRYPALLQIQVMDGQPRVTVREGADTDAMPDFQKDLGLSEPLTDLDDESIEGKLVPAARDDLARGRQQLLATIILMGINRIVISDGRINAKIKFNFSAREKRQMTASAFDYAVTGQRATSTKTLKNVGDGSDGSAGQPPVDTSKLDAAHQEQLAYTQMYYQNLRNRYAIGYDEQSSIAPDVRVTSQVDQQQQGDIQAAGQIMGEVSVNFRSDTFPLEKLVDTDQLQRLNAAQGAGRGAPPPPAPGATPSTRAAPSGGAAAQPPPPPVATT